MPKRKVSFCKALRRRLTMRLGREKETEEEQLARLEATEECLLRGRQHETREKSEERFAFYTHRPISCLSLLNCIFVSFTLINGKCSSKYNMFCGNPVNGGPKFNYYN